MDRPGYPAERNLQAGPLLTIICGAVFLATALAGTIEALILNQHAKELATAPICTLSTAGCRLHIAATVIGGYDEGSGPAPERHVDIKTSSGAVLHLTSPIVGAPPQVGSDAVLEYRKGKLVRFRTSAGTVRTADHPGRLSRTSRLLAWFALGLALLCGIRFMSAFRRGRPIPQAPRPAEFSIGVSHWFFVGVAVIVVFAGFARLVGDGFTGTTLTLALRTAGLVMLGQSLVILNAIGRKVRLTPDGLLYLRRFATFPSIGAVTLEPGRLPFSSLRIVTIQARNSGKPLAIDTKYFGWQNRVRLLQVVGSRASAARFDANATALREGEPIGKQPPVLGADPWQNQNRGCANALVGVGAALIVLSLVFETLGGPPIGGIWLFLVGAIFVGVGIIRNIQTLRAHFGRPRGDLLLLLEIVAPFVAWGIDVTGETSSGGSTRFLFRLLSLVPFLAVWIFIWVPLSRANTDQARIA